jgi:cytochrome P450
MECAIKILGPMIQDRLDTDQEHGSKWSENPNDLMTWLLEYVKGNQRTVTELCQRFLSLNLASVNSTSNILTQAIYRASIHEEYVNPMREEIKTVIAEGGWTHSAISRMVKVDSFLRECMRIEGPGQFVMSRVVVNPAGFKFHDGTTLPYGTYVSCGAYSIHHDQRLYKNPDQFDGFRFCSESDSMTGNSESKVPIVNSSSEFLAFGNGHHACPGR